MLVAAGVGGVAFLAYLLTAARDIFPGDTPEFVSVALTGGVAHAPGYPLFSIVGVLFGLLPLGPLPFRIDLIAVLCHAATVSLVFLTAERLTRTVLASAAAALVLAFGALFWSWGLVAETFPLNDLLAAAVLYCLVLWHARPSASLPLIGAAVAFALGIANQQTITLLVPAIAFVVYDQRAALRGRSRLLWQAAAAAVVAALVPYAYIPVAAGRHELFNWGEIQSPLDVIRQFFRLDYGTGQLIPTQAYQGGTGLSRLGDFARNVNPALALLGVLGAIQAYRRVRWYFWTTALAFFVSGIAFVSYANADVSIATARFVLARFYLLPQVAVAPLAALGIVFLAEQGRRRLADAPRRLPEAIAGAVFALAALELVVTFGAVDLREDHVARDFAIDLLATAPKDAVLLASGDHVVLPVLYAQAVEHVRPDVTVVVIPLLPADWYQRQLRARHPELTVPLARFDQPDGLKIFMQANLGRLFVLSGEQADQTFGGLYGLYGRGLTLPVIGPDAQLDLEAVQADNERLMASYHVPTFGAIKKESYERFILSYYALVPYRLGSQYEAAKRYPDARAWYERALAIDPELPEALAGLRRLQNR